MRTLSSKELSAVLAAHREWLDSNGARGARADFSDVNLNGVSLKGADLGGAVLHNADLSNAYLGGANLSNAFLRSTNLSNAFLRSTNLSNADLSNTNMFCTDLSNADLSNANLTGANLAGENLSNALLRSTNLSNANLGGANMRYAGLCYASLVSANLSRAKLGNADLRCANLYRANLGDAKVRNVKWPSPTAVLLANWAGLSDKLTQLCMAYDAMHHPDPKAFDRWAAGGPCPYDGVDIDRACNFEEKKDLWEPRLRRLRPSAEKLMRMLLKEKCDLSE